jgi:hypothetical protein
VSSTDFTYQGMKFYFEYDSRACEINIFSSDAWGDPDFEDLEDFGTGYWFPISKEKEIRWEVFAQNAKEVPEAVKLAAEEWIKASADKR